jgi:deoxyribodipyrimidine photo-lyase
LARAAILWLRRDLRLADHPALSAAVARGGPVVPAWIHSPGEDGESAPGDAARVFLHDALQSLSESLVERGSGLVLRRGLSVRALVALATESGAEAVYANRAAEPALRFADEKAAAELRENGLEVRFFEDGFLFPPHEIRTGSGAPFRVFTPFWRRCLSHAPPGAPLPAPPTVPSPAPMPRSLPLGELGLLPAGRWDARIRKASPAGESRAWARLVRFLAGALASYPEDRDRPGRDGTSRLSPYLHFGCIGARELWHAVHLRAAVDAAPGVARGAEAFARQLGWREFARHVLLHFPETVRAPLRPHFAEFPWRDDPEGLAAWQEGRTGFPTVDAGMRQLRATGWMHNRIRMLAASFLAKDLLLPWQAGAAWFMDKLADADLANNTLGWQWVAGCGADAAPYHRIFNPALQGEKFDPHGEYVRAWVPELAALPDRWIHRPWEAPGPVLSEAGVTLGRTYPLPIVDHAAARRRALAALPPGSR